MDKDCSDPSDELSSEVLKDSPIISQALKALAQEAIRTHPYTPPSAILHAESNLVETDSRFGIRFR